MTVLMVGQAVRPWMAAAPDTLTLWPVDSLDAARAVFSPTVVRAVLLTVDGAGEIGALVMACEAFPAVPVVVAVPPGAEAVGRECLARGAKAYLVTGEDPPAAAWRAVEAAILRPNHTAALREAKERAEEASRLKDKFVSLVAHDLRGPLGAIVGLLDLMLLRKDPPLPDVHRENVQFIVANGRTLLDVVEDLLKLSRIQTGKLTPEPRFVDAAFTVELALRKIGLLAQQKGIHIVNQVPVGTRLYTDPALFGQVMQNLLGNAIKFSHPGSAIEVSAADVDGLCHFKVRDHGVGIPAAKIDKLFRLEEKVSTPGTAGEPGTGFGLPLCAQIMDALGGSLSVVSEPGAGSTFTAAQPARRPRVLVVDDDGFFLRLLERRLRLIGAEVSTASNGREALIHLEESGPAAPDLVLADLAMPEMDGFALLAAVKGDGRWAAIPVIVITGETDAASRHRALSLGANDFTVKPCPDDDFIPRVRRYIG